MASLFAESYCQYERRSAWSSRMGQNMVLLKAFTAPDQASDRRLCDPDFMGVGAIHTVISPPPVRR